MKYLFSALAVLVSAASLLAQPESESPYSSSESFEPANVDPWYSSPILIIGLILIVGVVIYIATKGRKA